ncbi:MAG: hypothetical protein A2X25_06860 [Chloroflexi bacterium GWB2_49_20]|nr:MAG: hypothetical protein A2X25_06860 [Chloroflexi bacterium GWB2_49_20]
MPTLKASKNECKQGIGFRKSRPLFPGKSRMFLAGHACQMEKMTPSAFATFAKHTRGVPPNLDLGEGWGRGL